MRVELGGAAMIQVAPEVRDALDSGGPVVALETTLVSHGFPAGEGLQVALESERRVRGAGAVPATVGVIDGRVQVGLDANELRRFAAAGASARKAGPRDLAVCVAKGLLGATTVGGTLAACSATGIRFLGTGGIGGVHRGFTERPDVSADLGQLARTSVLVVSSGVKSLLDVPATLEVLEALGVPVLGWQTETLPLFYTAEGGPPVPAIVATADEAAEIARAHWSLGGTGLLLTHPPAESLDVETLIEAALAEARSEQVTGQDLTPFVLSRIHRDTAGESVRVNKRLIADNAALAAQVAVAYAVG
jgi:pseudouridylate synthase